MEDGVDYAATYESPKLWPNVRSGTQGAEPFHRRDNPASQSHRLSRRASVCRRLSPPHAKQRNAKNKTTNRRIPDPSTLPGMVPAVGIGIFRVVENTELIDFSRRRKRSGIRNCARLERIWNADSRLDRVLVRHLLLRGIGTFTVESAKTALHHGMYRQSGGQTLSRSILLTASRFLRQEQFVSGCAIDGSPRHELRLHRPRICSI